MTVRAVGIFLGNCPVVTVLLLPMWAKIYSGIVCYLLSLSVAAGTIALDVTLDVYEQSYPEDYAEKVLLADGWRIEMDKYGNPSYRLQIKLTESDIPFFKELGGAFIKIDQNFVVSMGMSVGDADAGTEASFTLPRKKGKVLPLSPVTIESSGGDYASGAWSFRGRIEIEVF